MTNAELIQTIRAEIERRKKEWEDIEPIYSEDMSAESMVEEFDSILSFLDTLEESSYNTQKYTPTPSVDIGDVARVQFASHAKVIEKKRKAIFDWEQFKEVAGIFYGFGKKNSSDTLEEKSEKPTNLDLEKEIENDGKDVIRQAHYHNKIFDIPQTHFEDVQLMDIFKAGVYKGCELWRNAK